MNADNCGQNRKKKKKKWWCEDVLWGKKKRKEGFWGELCDEKVGL